MKGATPGFSGTFQELDDQCSLLLLCLLELLDPPGQLLGLGGAALLLLIAVFPARRKREVSIVSSVVLQCSWCSTTV